MFPFANQTDLHTRGPVICRERRHWGDDGHELTQRRVGATQCPQCGLWWPDIEEPDEWTEDKENGRWNAIGWWGGTCCEECGLLMIEQPDGTGEVYDLRR